MKIINSRKLAMAFGGILIAAVAAGCYGGGPGYSHGPYGYNNNYSGYGNSYPNDHYNGGYSYPENSGKSYNAGYQNGVRSDENRDNTQHVVVVRARVEAPAPVQKSNVDHDKYSRNETEPAQQSVKN